jgi:hypothetical protein
MARSAADLALALNVLAGPDEMWKGIGYNSHRCSIAFGTGRE